MHPCLSRLQQTILVQIDCGQIRRPISPLIYELTPFGAAARIFFCMVVCEWCVHHSKKAFKIPRTKIYNFDSDSDSEMSYKDRGSPILLESGLKSFLGHPGHNFPLLNGKHAPLWPPEIRSIVPQTFNPVFFVAKTHPFQIFNIQLEFSQFARWDNELLHLIINFLFL